MLLVNLATEKQFHFNRTINDNPDFELSLGSLLFVLSLLNNMLALANARASKGTFINALTRTLQNQQLKASFKLLLITSICLVLV